MTAEACSSGSGKDSFNIDLIRSKCVCLIPVINWSLFMLDSDSGGVISNATEGILSSGSAKVECRQYGTVFTGGQRNNSRR